MAGFSIDDAAKTERLKAALWYATGLTVDAVALNSEEPLNATPLFIGGLSELVWTQIAILAADLEAFAKHAGRTVINCDDVLLAARRNEALADVLKARVKKARESNDAWS